MNQVLALMINGFLMIYSFPTLIFLCWLVYKRLKERKPMGKSGVVRTILPDEEFERRLK